MTHKVPTGLLTLCTDDEGTHLGSMDIHGVGCQGDLRMRDRRVMLGLKRGGTLWLGLLLAAGNSKPIQW